MRSLVQKMQMKITQYAQALVVLFAFALMVVSSYSFVSETEHRHLKRNAENAIVNAEINIRSDMLELETLLGVVSETINVMILRGENASAVNDYILLINNYVEASRGKRLYGATGIFGVFDVYDGRMLIGFDSWIPPDDYYQTDRPWYTAAIIAAGEINTTEPYLNVYSNEMTITLSRRIFDKNGNALGIICLNIELDRIQQYVVNTKFTEGGYGFLLNENYMVIAHPESSMVGTQFRDVKSGIGAFMDELLEVGSISEAVTQNYKGMQVIVFIEKLGNEWYMGVVTPRDNYFQSIKDLAVILTALGVIFAAILIWMLLRISAEKVKSDERVQIMFNASPLVAYIFNKDFQVIDCNENAVKLFDLSSKQEFCSRFYELLPEYQPGGRLTSDIGMEYNRKTLEEGSYCFEWTYQKFNGEIVPCEITCTRVMYKNDFIVVGYMRDLREQKKMLQEIRERNRLLDTVNSSATILLSNSAGESFEPSLLKSFELVGTCLDVDRVQIWRNEEIDGDMHFVLRYEWLSEYGRTCRPVPIGLHFPYMIKKDWEERFLRSEYINAPLSELTEEDQAFLGYYGMKSIVILPMYLDGVFWGFFSIDDCRVARTFSDEEISIITSAGLMMSSAVNRNMQIIKMRDADERTKIMFDAAPLGIFFWDKNLNLIDCNQEAVNLFGLSSKQEFIDKFHDLSPEYQSDGVLSSEKGPGLVTKALEEGYSRFEWLHQNLNGEPIPAEITCIRVKHKDEYTVTEYIRDLREQKAMIVEMRKAEVAEESSKAKSDFLAKMSHEIRTPMNAILGITEIQLQESALPQTTKEALERIYSSGDLLLGIINDILDLSKIEAGKLELLPAQYDIASLIHDTVQLNIMRYESKPIEFIMDVNENLPMLLIGDELRIKQILNNLLSNAFKYTQEGVVNLNITSDPEDENGTVSVIFSVSDTGQGMTVEQVKKLGTEYARFNMQANRTTEGTGLGMNITMNLIRMMKGTISIESTPGMGSTFVVHLPQKSAGSETIGRELADNLMQLNLNNTSKVRTVQIKREFMPYGRVLVVDDVETNIYVARGLLAPYGLSIDTAMSGFEAIEKIREGGAYDVVFMDHMMPKMDGIEATHIIRDMGYINPVVALTANALAGQAEMFLNNGFNDFISKPIDIRQLNTVLNKLIRDKQPPEVLEQARRQKNTLYTGTGQNAPLDPQIVEFFIRDAKKAAELLKEMYINKYRRSDDLSMFVINTHAMKSALANIGEMDLSSAASKLEQAGRDQDKKYILDEFPPFLDMLYDVIHKLEGEESPGEEAVVTEDELSDLKEKLLDIRAACSVYSKKAAKDMLAEIKRRTWPSETKEFLSTIAGYLLHSEFDAAAKAIDEYLQKI
jgi:signal transduction histidine kinase/DNA-binding response OmpR family regulator/HPt (histidine-containing phosphotransfer) domain-containing protein